MNVEVKTFKRKTRRSVSSYSHMLRETFTFYYTIIYVERLS